MQNAFHYEEIDNQIGILTFNLPGAKANKFSTPVMKELELTLNDFKKKTHLKSLLIFSGKPNIFIAGADIKEIETINSEEDGFEVSRKGQDVFNLLTQLPFTTIAVINGACMGGGTEFSLACTFRLASDHPKTKIAMPEVKLGIFPGWGGTQRLPRLIGLQRSLDIILTGRNLNAKRALRAGIVDKIIPKELARESAIEFAYKVIHGEDVLARSRRKQKGFLPILLEKNPVGRALVYRSARKTVLKNTKGHYPAPLAALESVRKGNRKSLKKGLLIEARLFSKLIGSVISKNLINLYNWTEQIKKSNGTANPDLIPKNIKKMATLGAGVMGGGIAQLFASCNIPSRVKDLNYDAVVKAYEQAARVLKGKLKRRRISKLEFNHILSQITGTIDYSGFSKTDLVIEAIIEDLEIKKTVFRELEYVIPDDTIVASNTSSLLIDDMAAVFKNPHRFVGMHFFNPVHRMPLVEVVQGANTSDDTIASIVTVAKKLGKIPIVVKDGPGFLVNRLLVPYMVEAISLLEEGIAIQKIDDALVQFGMPMGPIELFDEVGIDVAYKVAKILQKDMGERMAESEILEKMVKDQRWGKKNGKGFYRYDVKKKTVDPALYQYVTVRRKSDTFGDDLVKRMIYPMINEAARCLEDGIIKQPQVVDLAMIYGTGFPPFRGGLLSYADSLGVHEIIKTLENLTNTYHNRFEPSDMLRQIHKSGKNFYDFFSN